MSLVSDFLNPNTGGVYLLINMQHKISIYSRQEKKKKKKHKIEENRLKKTLNKTRGILFSAILSVRI